jgi:hypothetical protein
VLKRLHYPLDVILTCVRWYVAYPLSPRHLEDLMAERGVSVDHSPPFYGWMLRSALGTVFVRCAAYFFKVLLPPARHDIDQISIKKK